MSPISYRATSKHSFEQHRETVASVKLPEFNLDCHAGAAPLFIEYKSKMKDGFLLPENFKVLGEAQNYTLMKKTFALVEQHLGITFPDPLVQKLSKNTLVESCEL
ncbi:hypothetical protein N9O57_01525 [bacterium]|nr:hypothetical protein [bacterium]